MPSLFVESDAADPAPFRFKGDPVDLLALLSFGVAEPFGSHHPLTELVRRLKREHGIDVAPLLTFYDREVEEPLGRYEPGGGLAGCDGVARLRHCRPVRPCQGPRLRGAPGRLPRDS